MAALPMSNTDANSASVALLRGDEVLLIQRARAPYRLLWTLPGGRREPGETAEQCAIREVREELGLELFALRPLLKLRHGQFELQTFATQAFEGEVAADPGEIRGWRWVRAHQVPRLKTTPQLGEVAAAAFRIFDRT